ncbi:MAG: hypothetical protein M0Q38_10385 [Bacteroidales bacterium]|jgi:hypothetical protein|nr:hypothetical protein [Bacteroidales bacterium]
MSKKIKSVTITQNDFIIRNVTDEELDIRGHLSQFTEYDSNGFVLKEIKYDRMGIFEDMHLYTYDDKGFLITESYFQEEHEEAEKTIFEHDGSGLLTKSSKQYLDGSVDTTTYYYDENKRLVKKVTTPDDDEPEEVELFEVEEPDTAEAIPDEDDNNVQLTRNEKGQVILEEVHSADQELLTRVERKYDTEDNLSEVEVFIDGQSKTFTRHYILRYEYVFFEE